MWNWLWSMTQKKYPIKAPKKYVYAVWRPNHYDCICLSCVTTKPLPLHVSTVARAPRPGAGVDLCGVTTKSLPLHVSTVARAPRPGAGVDLCCVTTKSLPLHVSTVARAPRPGAGVDLCCVTTKSLPLHVSTVARAPPSRSRGRSMLCDYVWRCPLEFTEFTEWWIPLGIISTLYINVNYINQLLATHSMEGSGSSLTNQ